MVLTKLVNRLWWVSNTSVATGILWSLLLASESLACLPNAFCADFPYTFKLRGRLPVAGTETKNRSLKHVQFSGWQSRILPRSGHRTLGHDILSKDGLCSNFDCKCTYFRLTLKFRVGRENHM